jgi:hypothetical protein
MPNDDPNWVGITEHDVLEWEVDEILAFVAGHRNQQQLVSPLFNWDLLASIADQECSARQTQDRTRAMKWAQVAVIIYDGLSEQYQSISRFSRDVLEKRAMELRGWMIETFGPRNGDYFQDPGLIEAWFSERLTVDYHNASRLLTERTAMSDEQQYDLLALRDRTDILLPLASAQLLENSALVVKWSELFEKAGLKG